MSMHPYMARELARARQEDLHRRMILPRRPSRWGQEPSIRPLLKRRLRVRSPRPAPAR